MQIIALFSHAVLNFNRVPLRFVLRCEPIVMDCTQRILSADHDPHINDGSTFTLRVNDERVDVKFLNQFLFHRQL